MAVMGFSVAHPGPLPFTTVRDADKWAPRLTNGQIEICGENGIDLPQQMVRIAKVEPYIGACPPELLTVYHGKRLIAVHLEALDA
jgi:hypothetical protein